MLLLLLLPRKRIVLGSRLPPTTTSLPRDQPTRTSPSHFPDRSALGTKMRKTERVTLHVHGAPMEPTLVTLDSACSSFLLLFLPTCNTSHLIFLACETSTSSPCLATVVMSTPMRPDTTPRPVSQHWTNRYDDANRTLSMLAERASGSRSKQQAFALLKW